MSRYSLNRIGTYVLSSMTLLCSQLEAGVGLSLNFDGSKIGNGDVTGVAGFVTAEMWVNSTDVTAGAGTGASGSVDPLPDTTGTDIGTSVLWISNGVQVNGTFDGAGTNADLIYGGLNVKEGVYGTNEIEISSIPYKDYAVILYVKGWADGRTGFADLESISGSEKGFKVFKEFPGAHIESTSTGVSGTYVIWKGLAAGNLTVRVRKGSASIMVAGLQVVPSVQVDYAEVEAYRVAKGPNPVYGGVAEDEVIEKWIDILWDEGWNRTSGFDQNIKNIRNQWKKSPTNGSTALLQELNDYTNLIQVDGSLGNVRDEAWYLSGKVQGITATSSNRFNLTFQNTTGSNYGLNVSFFEGGIIRVTGGEEGFFDDNGLTAAAVTLVSVNGNKKEINFDNEDVSAVIQLNPFGMKIYRSGQLVFDQDGFDVTGSPADVTGIRIRFNADEEDHYIGFGERFDRLDNKGKAFAQWRSGMASGIDEGTPETYKPIAFYVNPKKSTGVFYNHGGIVRWDMEHDSLGVVDVTSYGGICDYYLFVGGDTHDVYRNYTAITGRVFDVEDWVHMPWMGHAYHDSSTQVEVDRILTEVLGYDARGVPHGALYAAGVGPNAGETQDLFNDYLLPLDIKFGAHLTPLWYTQRASFQALDPVEYLGRVIMREDASLFVANHAFQTGAAHHDFSSPVVFSDDIDRSGVHQIFMLDYGEQYPWDGVLYSLPGLKGRETHNLYQHFYHRYGRDVYEARYPGGNWMSFARSATAGDHALGGFFAGDHGCSMEHLERIVLGGVNFCTSAAVYWGADIGGYLKNPELTTERFSRWVQFGCFSPLMRSHSGGDKEMRPWEYSQDMSDTYKFFAWVRTSLKPYIRDSGELATSDGIPIMRALPIEFPNDADAYVEDQYMFGPSLLVAPYLQETVHSRNVYLPAGTWYNFFTGDKIAGGTTFIQTSPHFREMPVYVREGSVIPLDLGTNSAEVGKSYFATSGQTLYTDESIEAYRIYPDFNGTAADVFSRAAVSAEINGSKVEFLWSPTVAGLAEQVHFEVHNIVNLTKVTVNGVDLNFRSNWDSMINGGIGYYYDSGANVLYVSYESVPFADTRDIGTPAIAGSFSYDDSVYSIEGSGADIWGTADSFYYVSQVRAGDMEVVSRIDSVEQTQGFAKGGVMMRDTYNLSSMHVAVLVRPNKKVEMQWRTSNGLASASSGWKGDTTNLKWVKLVRSGDDFSGYYSVDGQAWTLINQVNVDMTNNIRVGLAVTSHDDTELCTAEFSNVSIE